MITEREKKWLDDNSSWIESGCSLDTFSDKAFSNLGIDSGLKLTLLFAEIKDGHSFYVKVVRSGGGLKYMFYIKMPNNGLYYLYSTAIVSSPLDEQQILTSLDHQARRLGISPSRLSNLYKNLQVSR